MNGYETEIFELHTAPGGLCTGWRRGEYVFDGYADREAYRAEKERLARAVVTGLAERFPGIEKQVEVTDVATPMTYERYTANWRASFVGWLLTTKSMRMMLAESPKTLPGLDRFHMIGQWTVIGGGIPPAAKDGRDVIKSICGRNGKKFRAEKA